MAMAAPLRVSVFPSASPFPSLFLSPSVPLETHTPPPSTQLYTPISKTDVLDTATTVLIDAELAGLYDPVLTSYSLPREAIQ